MSRQKKRTSSQFLQTFEAMPFEEITQSQTVANCVKTAIWALNYQTEVNLAGTVWAESYNMGVLP